jgi:hypothetical protein
MGYVSKKHDDWQDMGLVTSLNSITALAKANLELLVKKTSVLSRLAAADRTDVGEGLLYLLPLFAFYCLSHNGLILEGHTNVVSLSFLRQFA